MTSHTGARHQLGGPSVLGWGAVFPCPLRTVARISQGALPGSPGAQLSRRRKPKTAPPMRPPHSPTCPPTCPPRTPGLRPGPHPVTSEIQLVTAVG